MRNTNKSYWSNDNSLRDTALLFDCLHTNMKQNDLDLFTKNFSWSKSALSFRESKLIANHNKHQIEIYVKEFLEIVFAFFLLFKSENE